MTPKPFEKHSKDFFPLSRKRFVFGMENGHFVKASHRGLIALLYHTGVRISEALRSRKEDFKVEKDRVYFDVGQRLKHGLHTAPLPILFSKPYAQSIVICVENTKKKKRVWPYCRKTGYNIVDRVFSYPHHLRLTKITLLFRAKFTIDQVRSWTGHKEIGSLTAYLGFSNVEEMANA